MQAVHYMHSQGLAHRDLKLENFLIAEPDASLLQCTIKLIDFGLAARFEIGSASLRTVCGTPAYMAPEIFRKSPYNENCDVWSCGVILYTMLSGDLPFKGDSVDELVRNIQARPILFHPRVWSSVSRRARSLVKRTCCKAVAQRSSAQKVLADDWLKASEVEADKAVAALLTSDMLAHAEAFGDLPALQRASLHRVAYYMADEQVSGLREVFLHLDVNCDGKLTKDELLRGVDQAGLLAKDRERMADLFCQLDSDASGVLEYTEFLAAMACHRNNLSKQTCMAAFNCFDIDGSGTISVGEIRRTLARDGADEASAEPVDKILKQCDIDGDGEICFEEFMEMLRGLDTQHCSAPAVASLGGA